MALDPSELDMVEQVGAGGSRSGTGAEAALQAKYEGALREQKGHRSGEDFSDLVAEHAAKQRAKRKVQQDKTSTNKKHKEFKFW